MDVVYEYDILDPIKLFIKYNTGKQSHIIFIYEMYLINYIMSKYSHK